MDSQKRGTQQNFEVQRSGDTLRFTGPLLRANSAYAWACALPQLAGVRHFDIHAVTRVDSAGVALLAALVARVGTAQACDVALEGSPPGLVELCGAYRLTPALGYAL